MKWSFAGLGVFVLGIIGVSIIFLFQGVTTDNENDYYLLKEVTESAMIDSFNVSYYRETGNIKIVKEKFVENFVRRYGESTLFVKNDYKISFYDIMEEPPKVTILIDAGIGSYTVYNNTDSYSVQNYLSAILESKGKVKENKTYEEDYYYFLGSSSNNDDSSPIAINMPSQLDRGGVSGVKIDSITIPNDNKVTTQTELMTAILKVKIDWLGTNYDELSRDISDYNTNGSINISKINHYTCNNTSFKGTYEGFNGNVDCSKNKYWISINSSKNGKEILKFKIKWKYNEQQFNK